MTNSHDISTSHPARQLLGLTSALFALQVLNLAVFDDLRTDPSAGVLDTFTKPQHLSSIAAVLLAVVLVARRHRHAARVAVVVAWIEIAAFTFFHGIPVEIGPAKPYWGDGSGDALQWVGFLSILACSAAILLVAGRRSSMRALKAPVVSCAGVIQSDGPNQTPLPNRAAASAHWRNIFRKLHVTSRGELALAIEGTSSERKR